MYVGPSVLYRIEAFDLAYMVEPPNKGLPYFDRE